MRTYVPGWDCHGLPIEWKIEEEYRAKGRDKDAVPIVEFRHECREFAEHWIDVQRSEFDRLGVEGDWGNPYTTMAYKAEAQIIREIGKFLMNGGLYKGVEAGDVVARREDRVGGSGDRVSRPHLDDELVRFRSFLGRADLQDATVVIWTTTPWTIPGNRAIAYGPEIDTR